MKLKRILPALILFLFAIISLHAQQLNKSEWEQGIAILSKNVNILSLEEQKEKVEAGNAVNRLTALAPPFSVEDVRTEIPVKYKNSNGKELCDELNTKLIIKMPSTREEAVTYLSQKVFDNELKSFLEKNNNRKSKRADLEQKIKEDLNYYFSNQEVVVAGGRIIDYPSDNAETTNGGYRNQSSPGAILYIVIVLAFIIMAVLAFFGYKITNDFKDRNDELKRRIKELQNDQKILTTNMADIQDELNSIISKVNDIRENRRRETFSKDINDVLPNEDAISHSITSGYNSFKFEDIKVPEFEPEPLIPVIKEYYLPGPTKDGFFQVGTTEYHMGDSLYMLKTLDGKTGTYSFLKKGEAVVTALSSVSSFLRPACTINGNSSIQNVQSIITESEGTVIREGDGWRITDKALVRFE